MTQRAHHELLTINASDAGSLHQLGVQLYQRGDSAQAVEKITEAIALQPDVAQYHANLAEAYRTLGKLDQAIDSCQAALTLRPDYPQALNNLGVCRYQQQRWSEAEQHFRASIELQPDNALTHSNLADALREQGQLHLAIASYEQALRLNPRLAAARANLGSTLMMAKVSDADQQQWSEAEHHFRKAIEFEPDNALSHRNLADALREQGKLRLAIASYEDALRSNPNLAAAHANLGCTLLITGDSERAVSHCQRAVDLEASATHWNNLGQCHRDLGQFDEAMAAFEEALYLDPQSLELANNIGRAWQDMGDLAQARAWYERAKAIDPQDQHTRCNLASVLAELDRLPEAVNLYQEVLAEYPEDYEALQGLARTLWDDGDPEGALELYRRAAELRPEFAQIHAGIGHVLSSMGNLAGAVASFRKALEMNPRLPSAHGGLAHTLRGRLDDNDLSAIQGVLRAGKLRQHQESALRFGLAVTLDRREAYDEAAEQLAQANALQHAFFQGRGRIYDPDEHDAFVDRLIENYTPEYFRRIAGLGSKSQRPVFVVGMPRSGTTLTEQILASHPDVFGAGERHYLTRGLDQLAARLNQPESPPLDCLSRLHADDPDSRRAVSEIAQWHLERLASLDGGSSLRIVDKMPDNYLHLGWILSVFPQARIIHCRRDVRDVAVSCWMTNFSRIVWASDVENLSRRIAAYQRLTQYLRQTVPDRFLEIDYERLVADPATESRRVISWIGLQWDDACLAFHQNDRTVRTASVAQVREPVYTRSAGRWQRYQQALGAMFERLGSP